MMGTKTRNTVPLISISLEDLVPKDHLYRRLDQQLDLSFVYAFVQENYAKAGRPSIDPIVFFKLQLVMFFEGLRSERQLMRQAADSLSIRWYLGYNLGEVLPDHSSLTRIRTRYGVGVFRRFFETVVDQCQQAGLVWGKELYADATKVQANAAVNSLKPRFAVEAHLEHLFALASTAEPNSESDGLHDDGSLSDAVLQGTTERSLPEGQSVPREQEESPLPRQLHPTLDAGVYEELTRVNSERHEWIEREGEPNRAITRGHDQRLADFQVRTTDPDATVMQTKGGGAHLGYHTHYIVDGGKARIILAALVTPKARAGKSAGARSRLPNAFSLEVASPPIRPSPRPMGPQRILWPWKSSRFAPMFLCPISISGPNALDNAIFAIALNVMSTSVPMKQNCICYLPGVQTSTCSTEPRRVSAMLVLLKPNARRAIQDAN